MNLYHRTHPKYAAVILSHGFSDGPNGERRTVFDRPPRYVEGGRGNALLAISLDLDPELLCLMETTPHGVPWRSFEVPASILNAAAKVEQVDLPSDDDGVEPHEGDGAAEPHGLDRSLS